MKHAKLINEMMTMNIQSRLWHWQTPKAQHHTTFEAFLTQNEELVDRYVESALGNDINLNFTEISLDASGHNYDLAEVTKKIKAYRDFIGAQKEQLEGNNTSSSSELVTILDDVTELSSKTLYLLKLS